MGKLEKKRIISGLFFYVSFGLFAAIAAAQGLPVAQPQAVGMSATKLNGIDEIVNAGIAESKMPGAVVIIGHKGKIVFRKAYGNRSVVPTVEKMTIDTIFDVASLTKPVATAASIMILVEQGKLRLSDTIGKFIPEIDDAEAKKITILQLLTHTSGYRPDFDLAEKWIGREGMLAALKKEKLRNPPGTKFVYSDIGFIVLGEVIQRVTNLPLNEFAKSEVLRKVGSSDFFFSPLWLRKIAFDNLSSIPGGVSAAFLDGQFKRIAPTENIRGQSSYLGASFDDNSSVGNEILKGAVHDPTAFRMGGVAGHAGLFSTADDLARYSQMILNGGTLDGKRILSAQTVALMTRPNVVSEDGATRGLGWDINTAFSSNRGEFFPLGSFGHTGFTGTSIWIDPASQTFVVFMSNRVHPDGKGDVTDIRAKVATIAAAAIEDMPIEKWKAAEAEYSAMVGAQLPKFKAIVDKANPVSGSSNPAAKIATKTVLNGIDVLERDGFKMLAGKRIGLVTNQTGRNLAGKSTIDVLFATKNLTLTSLFAPEHGIRGELDQDKIDDAKDEKTGLPIYSLYGESRRPKPEQLKDLDAIVYDIQDIGVRFWTYSATLRNVLEEAAKANIPVFVLDRPNPIGGIAVEGPLADEDKLSFVAAHTIPVRHGMTIGEYGQMMNAEQKINAKLSVIKMQNWSRAMWFDETGQTWVNPSPNMRSLTEATLYPGIGLFETTNISVGRGTDTPFEVVGAPWIDEQKFAEYLNERGLPGVRFVPIRYRPTASVYKDEVVGGINIIITDRKAFMAIRTGLEIAVALQALYGTQWQAEKSIRLVVNRQTVDQIKAGAAVDGIEKSFEKDLQRFLLRRASYLLYKQ